MRFHQKIHIRSCEWTSRSDSQEKVDPGELITSIDDSHSVTLMISVEFSTIPTFDCLQLNSWRQQLVKIGSIVLGLKSKEGYESETVWWTEGRRPSLLIISSSSCFWYSRTELSSFMYLIASFRISLLLNFRSGGWVGTSLLKSAKAPFTFCCLCRSRLFVNTLRTFFRGGDDVFARLLPLLYLIHLIH